MTCKKPKMNRDKAPKTKVGSNKNAKSIFLTWNVSVGHQTADFDSGYILVH